MSNHANEERMRVLRRNSTCLSRRSTSFQAPITAPVDSTSFLCGLLAGVSQAGLFNPYDRALYLSVKDNTPFLSRANWKNPYSGFLQSIGHRAIAGGLYFPIEHFFLRQINANDEGSPALNFLSGTLAGAANASILNPLSAIKYKTWGRETNKGMMYEVSRMMRIAGIRPFLNGLSPTVARDVAFGGTYTWLRLQIQVWFELESSQQYLGNFVAAALATVVSGPFNYVRNIQFATRSHQKADRMVWILKDLVKETSNEKKTAKKFMLLQNRLRIGWGTARVAVGMSFAHAVYDWLHSLLNPTFRFGKHGVPK